MRKVSISNKCSGVLVDIIVKVKAVKDKSIGVCSTLTIYKDDDLRRREFKR